MRVEFCAEDFSSRLRHHEDTIATAEGEKLDHLITASGFYGCVEIRYRGKIWLKRGYGYRDISKHERNTPDLPIAAHHLSELVTTLLFLQCVQKNLITLEETLDRFFPARSLRWPHLQRITLGNLLHHCAGLPPWQKRPSCIEVPLPTEQILDLICKKPPLFSPGEFFYHSHAHTRLLVALLEQVTGRSYVSLVEQLAIEGLFSPTELPLSYTSEGRHKTFDHISLRRGCDDTVMTTAAALELQRQLAPFREARTILSHFKKREVITQAAGQRAEFLFGKRLFIYQSGQGALFCVPQEEIEGVILGNKAPASDCYIASLVSHSIGLFANRS